MATQEISWRHVRAVQDELPAVTERLLEILENAIKETPVTS